MKKDLSERLIESAARMIEHNDKQVEVMQKLDGQSMSRIVWFVAIAGFALLNIPLAASYTALSPQVPLMLLVWVLTAFLGAFTHWQFRNRSVATIHIYLTRRELLMAYIANGAEAATMADLTAIVGNAKEPLPKLNRSLLSATRFADLLELLSMISFVISMSLTVFTYVDVIWP